MPDQRIHDFHDPWVVRGGGSPLRVAAAKVRLDRVHHLVYEGVGTPSASRDAMVHLPKGEASITLGDTKVVARSGQVVVMPAEVPHSVQAEQRFKRLPILVKKSA